MSAIGTFYRISAAEKMLVLRICLRLNVLHLSLGMFDFERFIRTLKTKKSALALTIDPTRVAQLVDMCASQFFWANTCLIRSAVKYELLAPQNPALSLVIGVKKNANSKVEAHAWIENPNGIAFSDESFNKNDFSRILEI